MKVCEGPSAVAAYLIANKFGTQIFILNLILFWKYDRTIHMFHKKNGAYSLVNQNHFCIKSVLEISFYLQLWALR
jgi:hypothetical protein